MRKHRRRDRKKQKRIIAFSTIGIIGLFSIGYAAFSSNFLVSGKGTIVEKPITIDELKDKKCNTTIGDGLYIDTYENDRCIYKGTNPDNFISFNNELWRIIAIENDNSLKIMRNGSIGDMAWDSSNSNNWKRPATLNTYLNGQYYETLNAEAKKIVKFHDFPIGPVVWSNEDLNAQIISENSEKWNGKIGLMSVSDYFRANTNMKECGNFKLQYGNGDCQSTNYIYGMSKLLGDNKNVWMINRRGTDVQTYGTYVVFLGGSATTGNNVNMTNMGVMPTLYLDPNIKVSGKGTEQNPYKVTF